MIESMLASVVLSAAMTTAPLPNMGARSVVVPEAMVVDVANRKGAKRVGGTNSKGKGSKYKGGKKK